MRSFGWRRVGFAICAGVALTGALLVAVVLFTALPGRLAREPLLAFVERRYGVVATVDRFELDLLRLRVAAADLEMATPGRAGDPFLTVAEVVVDLPWSAVRDGLVIDELRLDRPVVSVVREADGSSNLPGGGLRTDFPSPAAARDSGTPATGAPAGGSRAPFADAPVGEAPVARLPIRRLDVRGLAVDWRDDAAGLALHLPATAVGWDGAAGELPGGAPVSPESGEAGPGERQPAAPSAHRSTRISGTTGVSWGGAATEVVRFEGDLGYDGSALHVGRLTLTAAGGSLTLRGSVDALLGSPRLGLDYEARLDLAQLASRLPGAAAHGAVWATGTLRGGLDEPEVSAELHGAGLTWGPAALERLAADLTLTPEALTLHDLRSELADGILTAAGEVGLAAGWPGRLEAAWNGLDVGRLLATRAPDLPLAVEAVAEGSLSARWTALAADAVDLSARTRLLRGAGAAGGARLEAADGRWRLALDPTLGGALGLSGALEAVAAVATRGDGDRPDWRAARLTGGVTVACEALDACRRVLARPALELLADARGSATARFTVGGTLGRPEVTGVVEAPVLAVGPQVLRDFTARVEANSETVRVALPTLAVGPNAVEGALRIRLPDGAVDGWLAAEVAELASFGPLLPAALAPSGEGRILATVAGELDRVHGHVAFGFDALEMGGRPLGTVAGWGRVDGAGRLRAVLSVPVLAAAFEAEADLRGGGAFEVRGRVREGDPGRLFPTLPLTGRVTAEAIAAGSLADPAAGRVDLRIAEAEGSVGALTVGLTGPAAVTYEGGAVRVSGLELGWRGTRLRLAGGLGPRGDGALAVRLSGAAEDLAELLGEALGSGAAIPALEAAGEVSLELTASGTWEAIDLTGEARLEGGSITLGPYPPLTGIAVRAALRDGALRLEELRAAWEGAEIEATADLPLGPWTARLPAAIAGRLPARPRPARVRATLESLSPAALAGYVDSTLLDDVGGRVSAMLDLEVPATGIRGGRGRLTLTEAALEMAGVSIAQQRPTVVAFEDGRAVIAAFEWGNERDAVVLGGGMELGGEFRTEGWMEGAVDLGRLPELVPDLAAAGVDAGGEVRVRARVSGPLGAPDVRGSVELTGGELRIAEPRLEVTELAGALSVTGDTVAVDHLAGSANGGRVAIGGAWSIGGAPEARRVTVAGTGIALDFPRGLRTETDVDLAFGEERGGLALTGSVTVLRGAYREPITLAGGLIELLRQETASMLADDAPDDEAAGVLLDIRAATRDDVIVDNNYVEAELGGTLRVGGTTRVPVLAGRVALREGGRVRFGNRVYEIDAGAVDFADPEGITPDVTLTARTSAGGYDITLGVRGTPDDLTTSLESEPPLPESDIASVLLTGRLLGRAEAPLSAAGEQVLGLASTELLGPAGRGVGLDLEVGPGASAAEADIRFDSSLVSTDRNPASRLTVSRDLREDVRLVFSRSLREDDLVWLVDYRPRSGIELRALFDDEDERAYEFRHALPGRDRVRGGGAAARPSLRVAGVAVRGETGVEAERLRDLLALRAGDRFDFLRQQRDRDRLVAALEEQGFREAHVRPRREVSAAAGTVALVYEIVRGPRTDLVITGYDLPDAERRELDAIWARSVFDTVRLEELEARVGAHLADRGYLRASVAARIVAVVGAAPGSADGAPATKRIEVRVNRGPRSDARRLRFEGAAADDERDLRALLREGNLDRAAWTDPERLAAAVAAWYHRRGWLRATAEVGEPRFRGRSAELPVRVAAGPRFRVGAVELSGALSRPVAAVRGEAGLDEGAPYTEDAVAVARARIVASYRRAGHATATVAARRTFDEASATVDVRFDVSPGPRQVVRTVVVEGAPRTDPGFVRSALAIEPGAPVDPAAWSAARKRLYDTGAFRSVDIEALAPDARGADAATDGTVPVEARVRLEEWPRYRLRYGLRVVDDTAAVGESTGRALRLGAVGELSRRNLLGRGWTAGLSTRVDREQQALRAFLTIPTLLGRPVETNLFAARRRDAVPAAGIGAIDVTTFTAEQRFRPRPGTLLAASANLDVNRTPGAGSGPPPPLAVAGHVARIDGSAVVDTRDNLFDATRGFYHSSNVEYGAELGSPRTFFKYLGQQFFYRRLGRVVLATAARIGLATGLGDEVVATERFFAGGGNTVRGYAQNSLGPATPSGAPEGGNTLVVLNQEARIPLWRRVAAVGFVDAGRVFRSARDVALRDLAVGVGLGVRVESPVGLVRLDYGFALRRRPGEPRGRMFVSLGQAF